MPLWESLTLGYTDGAGHPAVIPGIAEWLGLEPEDVVTFRRTMQGAA